MNVTLGNRRDPFGVECLGAKIEARRFKRVEGASFSKRGCSGLSTDEKDRSTPCLK